MPHVSPRTLQRVRYPNVFSLDDVASAPNSKTATAVRKQALLSSTTYLQ